MSKPPQGHEEAIRRAALPEVMFSEDIALALCLRVDQAEEGARAGRFGPEIYVDGRVAVLREDFLQTLTQRAAVRGRAGKEVMAARPRPTPPGPGGGPAR